MTINFLFSLIIGGCIFANPLCASLTEEFSEPEQLSPQVFTIEDLNNPSEMTAVQLRQALYRDGLIAISGVPGFLEAAQDFHKSMSAFVALPDDEKALYTPDNWYERGWAYGRESVAGVPDYKKGSYYGRFPDDGKNVFPKVDSFNAPAYAGPAHTLEHPFMTLCEMIQKTGLNLLKIVDDRFEDPAQIESVLGRGLYYGPEEGPKVPGINDAPWCGEHRDHGVLTGLIPDAYMQNGVMLHHKPQGAGLFVFGKEVAEREPGLMVFQIGEALEIFTRGRVKATPHHVSKAYEGISRTTMAVFFDMPGSLTIVDNAMDLEPELLDRVKDRLTLDGPTTYGRWGMNSFHKYNKQ